AKLAHSQDPSALLPGQKFTSDALPFAVQRTGIDRLPRAAVPVGSVAQIAFDAMQIGVYPCTVARGEVLDQIMRLIPVIPRRIPQCLHHDRRIPWWLRVMKCLLERFKSHHTIWITKRESGQKSGVSR